MHKINGLKGSAILIKNNKVNINPIIFGGQQEYGYRGGTTNILPILLIPETIKLALDNLSKYNNYLIDLKDYFIKQLNTIKELSFNTNNIGTNIISIRTIIKSEIIINMLNKRNIMVSGLSTCHAKNKTSHVLTAIGLNDHDNTLSFRISFSKDNTKEEVDRFIIILKEILNEYKI